MIFSWYPAHWYPTTWFHGPYWRQLTSYIDSYVIVWYKQKLKTCWNQYFQKIYYHTSNNFLRHKTGSRRHFTIKSQLLLVNFYFVLSQFKINISRFSLVFLTYVLFCTQIVLIHFLSFLVSNCLSSPKQVGHMLSISMSTILQVTKNWLTSKTDGNFNISQIKSQFPNHHRTIELPFDRSI